MVTTYKTGIRIREEDYRCLKAIGGDYRNMKIVSVISALITGWYMLTPAERLAAIYTPNGSDPNPNPDPNPDPNPTPTLTP